MAAFALARAVAPATAHPLRGELYYTRYLGAPNLNKIPFAFDGKAMTLGRKTPVANLLGADGLGFAADGRLIVGGQGDRVHAVRIGEPGGQQSVSAGGAKVFHVAIGPDVQGQVDTVNVLPLEAGVEQPRTHRVCHRVPYDAEESGPLVDGCPAIAVEHLLERHLAGCGLVAGRRGTVGRQRPELLSQHPRGQTRFTHAQGDGRHPTGLRIAVRPPLPIISGRPPLSPGL